MTKPVAPGTKFTYAGKPGVVLYQVQKFVAPGKPYKPVDNYRVEIPGSPIEYGSAAQIRLWMKGNPTE